MATHIHGHRPVTISRQDAGQFAPRMPGLAATMKQDHWRTSRLAGYVSDKPEPRGAVQMNSLQWIFLRYGPRP